MITFTHELFDKIQTVQVFSHMKFLITFKIDFRGGGEEGGSMFSPMESRTERMEFKSFFSNFYEYRDPTGCQYFLVLGRNLEKRQENGKNNKLKIGKYFFKKVKE